MSAHKHTHTCARDAVVVVTNPVCLRRRRRRTLDLFPVTNTCAKVRKTMHQNRTNFRTFPYKHDSILFVMHCLRFSSGNSSKLRFSQRKDLHLKTRDTHTDASKTNFFAHTHTRAKFIGIISSPRN